MNHSGLHTTCALIVCLSILTLAAEDVTGAARKVVWNSREDFERCTRDGSVEVTNDGTVRLAKTVLLQDEQGLTHYNNTERLSNTVWAKKQFVIDDPACDGARLFVYGGAAAAACNGRELPKKMVLESTGWVYWNVPPELLKNGLNEFVLSGSGGLVIESSLHPNRSAKSLDGGRTWNFDRLGNGGVENGEYLVRLRLAQYPKQGVITSEVIDLAAGTRIRPQIKVEKVGLQLKGKISQTRPIIAEARTGDTPRPDPSWSPWKQARMPLDPKRFVQWRAAITARDAKTTQEIDQVTINATVEVVKPAEGEIKVLELTPVTIRRGSHPFAYQRPGHRLGLLSKTYKLDEVVAKGKTELEKFVLLREWVRFTAPKGWDIGSAYWVPPWDALILLETNKKPIALCMCTHYSTIFVQCALALGYNARQVILDHHCTAEVWSNQFRKWIFIDTGNSTDPNLNCHFERNGVPLNALELRRLWKADRTGEIDILYTPPRGRRKGTEIDKNQCGFANFRRFAIPFRNNHLDTPFPGELEHGQANYYCDMYLWWEDEAVPTASPEYGKTTCRPADFYWTLNETAIRLQETDAADALQVTLDTVTPNFKKFFVSIDGAEPAARAASFKWKLHEGENTLRVKSVNAFGVEGIESVARLTYGK